MSLPKPNPWWENARSFNRAKGINMQAAAKQREPIQPIMLRGGRVTGSFKTELMDAANRAGMSANEYCLHAAAEKLQASGRSISGLFWPGDLKEGKPI